MAGAHVSRIIAGSRRGRHITMPSSDKTRPTTDRVREALFSAITSWAGTSNRPPESSLDGFAFGDLFAGSGAVGLEAASRGAAPVLLVEADRRAASTMARNVSSLGLAAQVITARVEHLTRLATERSFDVVFADPPYDQAAEQLDATLAGLVDHGWVAPDGLIVVERSRRSAEPRWPPGFNSWSRRYGETVLFFGQRLGGVRASAGPPAPG
jgi:16S rRNA (guanine966-N2)-methyltransferase